MKPKIFISFILLIAALLLVTPAIAITYGEPDGNDHPSVGSLVLELGGNYYQICTGTLIDDDVFLTAAHCTLNLDYYVDELGADVWVTFDATINAGGTFYAGVWYTNPNFGHDMADLHDVSVIVLDVSPGITPAKLPKAGLLDNLKDEHILKDTHFTAVGYGTVRDTNQKGPQAILDNLDRNRVEQEFLSLTKSWLTLSMNYATGNGGTCYGDSGGPHFIHIDGVETDIVASITVTGDAQCKATDKTYRMDTESAQSFLDDFVDLP